MSQVPVMEEKKPEDMLSAATAKILYERVMAVGRILRGARETNAESEQIAALKKNSAIGRAARPRQN